MEKKNRTGKRKIGTVILMILLLALIDVEAYIVFSYDKKIEVLDTEISKIDLQLDEINKKNEELEKSLTVLNEEKDELNTFDETLVSLKEEYFSKLKELENKVLSGESSVKIAYLTFDDGPYDNSEKFLDVLEEYDIPATFFVLMKCAETGYVEEDEAYDHVYRRIIESGHTLGNHTRTHKFGDDGVYSSLERFMYEITSHREFIYERYGYTTDIMRFPGGSFTSSLAPQIIKELQKLHYAYVDWNVSSGDGGKVRSPEEFRDIVLTTTNGRKFIVVLMHDYSTNTLLALPEIIEGLADQGYSFFPLFYDSYMTEKE
ncbi:MAG: polysaccharide deacetylase family protein [Erysipelotrichaceae bacterium]|nr:polysaccharide deacetylase family protein [Erysipelotrichaceae bacterium]